MRLRFLSSRTFCRRFFNRWRRDFFNSRRCLCGWGGFFRWRCLYRCHKGISWRSFMSRFLYRFRGRFLRGFRSR